MFKWIKKSVGCNCKPLPKGTERYWLDVGDVWGGIVESHQCEHEPEKVYWSGWYTVCGKKVSGQSGGGSTRDDLMQWIEGRILESIGRVFAAKECPTRKIHDALFERNPETGELFQREVD